MLIPSFRPLLGGAERQLEGLLSPLTRLGVNPFVLTRRVPGTAPRATVKGVPVIRTWAGTSSVCFLASSFAYLVRHSTEWDLIHVHTLDSPSLSGVAAGHLLGKPIIAKVTRSGSTAVLHRLQSSLAGRVRLRYLRSNIQRFVAISPAIEKELLACGVAQHQVAEIPNGVDTDRYVPLARSRRAGLRKELGLRDVPTALYSGRLIPRKRLDSLISIWPAIRRSVPGAALVIAGEGPERGALEAHVQDLDLIPHVRILGELGTDQVREMLQAADCFVLPSTSEGLSNALLEAMSAGLAPVVSSIPSHRAVVNSGHNGLVFEGPVSLTKQVVRCLSEPQFARDLGTRARATIVERFSISDVALQLASLYRSLLSPREESVY